MPMMYLAADEFEDGHYWCRHPDEGSNFIILIQNHNAFVVGVPHAVQIPTTAVICRAKEPLN